LEVVARKKQALPTNMKLHPYEGKGKFDEFLHMNYKENSH
jgi:hypothetical protein